MLCLHMNLGILARKILYNLSWSLCKIEANCVSTAKLFSSVGALDALLDVELTTEVAVARAAADAGMSPVGFVAVASLALLVAFVVVAGVAVESSGVSSLW